MWEFTRKKEKEKVIPLFKGPGFQLPCDLSLTHIFFSVKTDQLRPAAGF